MAAGVQAVKQRKAKLQAWVSRISDTAHECLANGGSVDEMTGIYTNLKSKFDNYKAVAEELVNCIDDERELDTLLSEMTKYDNDVEVLLARLSSSSTAHSSRPMPGQSAQSSSASAVKLPKLQLRVFGGETALWPEFWDLFQVAVHNNPQLPVVQKFVHLKSLLHGEAATCIAAIPTIESNYSVAVDRLLGRYGKPESVRYRLLTKISAMKPLENYKTLRDGVDDLTATIRALEVQGVSHTEYSTLLMPIIEARMPKTWRLLWARKKTADTVTFRDLIRFLETEVEVKEMADREPLSTLSSNTRKYEQTLQHCETDDSYEGDLSTATALHIRPSMKCTFCGDNHRPSDCVTSMSVDDRFNKVREAKACFRCAIPRHRVSSCRWKKPCACGRLHIPQLCTGPRPSTTLSATAASFHPPETRQPQDGTLTVTQAQGHGLRMRTVSIRVGQHIARVLCDTGSTYSLMSTRMARSVPHKTIGKRRLRIQAFGSIMEEEFTVIRVTVEGVVCRNKLTMDVLVSDAVVGSFEQLDAESVRIFRSHFGKDAVLADVLGDNTDPLDMIVGEDYYDALVIGHPVVISGGLKATLTIFGWMLHGRDSHSSIHTNTACVLRATVQEQLAEFWNLEHLGVSALDLEKQDLESDIRSSLCLDDCGQYTVEWPWKPQARQHLASNKILCERRLQKLIARMSDEEYKAYDSHIKQLEIDGHIERTQQGDVPECYLPHRGVVKSSSTTTKLRIVYDASAKSAGLLSLNDALEKGPNLLPLLWGILLRFRVGRVAVVGDLEKAFLQINLQENERNVCCFLWKPPGGDTVVYRLTRVFFGATSSPFLLQVVLKHHLEKETTEEDVARTLLRNLYVDDTVNSVNNDVEAEEFWHKSVEIFQRGGFNLRKLQTNAKSLQSCMDAVEQEPLHKVLGISWDILKDEVIPLAHYEPAVTRATKRQVASLMASIYDPLGLIIPVVTPLKCLLQDLWKQKTSWDVPLHEVHQERLTKILSDMTDCKSLTIPRWMNTSVHDCSQAVSIHVFVDASSRAYAAVAYVCVKSNADIVSTLVTAKCRLATPAGETIPRLELIAFLMGARLMKSLMAEFEGVLQVKRWILWSDSTIALSWVEKGSSVGGVFVSNRVSEIRTVDVERRWVPSNSNPADIPTRGTSVHELAQSSLWWHGPSWLQLDEEQWPQCPAINSTDNDDAGLSSSVAMVTAVQEPTQDWLIDLVDPARTSKWMRTVRSVCWIMRWRYPSSSVYLEPSELKQASKLIFSQVQKKLFQQELIALDGGNNIPRQSCIKSLHPFLHEGLIRMGGRLQCSHLPFEEKHPVLLKRCGVVDQLILAIHEQMQHAGASFVISELRRQGLWILRPKKAVSSVVRTCRKCRRFIAAPAAEVTAPYPTSRVNLTRAFATTGMDLGGPLYLKDESKAWFVVFTCMSVRAIHLELVTALSEEALVFAVQRFMARRGIPKKFVSDHGTNFVALARWLKVHSVDIQYQFIVERGPWWGGVWERLVQTVKGLLRRSIGKALLTWEQLETVLIEVEKVINRRPISFQWEGPQPCDGVPVPIYPEMFLLPPHESTEEQRTQDVTLGLQQRKLYFQDINDIWRREYLLQVLGAKGEIWRSNPNPLQLGEVVLIGDGDKRLCWKLGVVQELHRGRDGCCRAASVRAQSGLLRRPIQKLFKLELHANDADELLVTDSNTDADVDILDSVGDNADIAYSDDTDRSIAENKIQTRCGRMVKKPGRYV